MPNPIISKYAQSLVCFNIDDELNYIAPTDLPFRISINHHHYCSLPFTYKLLPVMDDDFQRIVYAVRTDVYPLIWLFWRVIAKLEFLNWLLKSKVYFTLLKLNNDSDYIPHNQLVGGYFSILTYFLKAKLKWQ